MRRRNDACFAPPLSVPLPLLALFVLLVSGCLAPPQDPPLSAAQPPLPMQSVFLTPSNASLLLEVARTPLQLEAGLMYRTRLGPNEGMVFYLPKADYAHFWMARTTIPLDILFLDENKTIIDIQTMAPCTASDLRSCPVYSSRAPAKYAIELNANSSRSLGIRMGDQANLSD